MPIKEYITKIKEESHANFDESVEVVINLKLDIKKQGGFRTTLSLPHGTGKTLRIETVGAESVDAFVSKLGSGKGNLDFDVLIAEPLAMPKLSKVAKILGPKGLYPNPKNGTVTEDLEKTKKELSAGKMEIKTEANAPIIKTVIGKVSFDEKALAENYETILKALEGQTIKSIYLKSTMGKPHSVLS